MSVKPSTTGFFSPTSGFFKSGFEFDRAAMLFFPRIPFDKFPQPESHYLRPVMILDPVDQFPSFVPFMPCPNPDCALKTKRNGWVKMPHIVHTTDSYFLLLCARFVCPEHKEFNSFNKLAFQRLPKFVQNAYGIQFFGYNIALSTE